MRTSKMKRRRTRRHLRGDHRHGSVGNSNLDSFPVLEDGGNVRPGAPHQIQRAKEFLFGDGGSFSS
jgi:hypothetical protein